MQQGLGSIARNALFCGPFLPSPSLTEDTTLIRPLSDLFPATSRWIYVDSVTQGLLPVTARDRAIEYLDAHLSANVTQAGGPWTQMAADCRQRFANLIRAEADCVSLFSSFAGAADVLARAVKPRPDRNIVVCTSLSRPGLASFWRYFAIRHGCKVMEIEIDGETSFPLQRLDDAINDKTEMVMLPAVSHARGWRLPIAEIGALCRKRGVFFLVDATSSVGILELDVVASTIDGVVVAAHGNAMGICGVCFLYIDESRMAVGAPGFSGLVAGCAGAHKGEFSGGVPGAATAGAHAHLGEELHPLSLITAREVLTLLVDCGIRRIEIHVLGLAARLRLALQELGLPVEMPGDEQHCSHVVAVGAGVALPDGAVATPALAKLAGQLTAGRVRYAACGGQLQFGFHLYNRLRDVMDVRRVIVQTGAG